MPPRRETESLPRSLRLESSVEAYCMVERVLNDFSLQSRPLFSPIASLQPQLALRAGRGYLDSHVWSDKGRYI